MTLTLAPTFRFIDPGPLVDGELELIRPTPDLTDEFLRTCAHPLSRAEPAALITRQQLGDFFRAAPDGRQLGDPSWGRPAAYHFWMRVERRSFGDITIAGTLGLRVGRSPDLEMYLGHVGYHVYPPARGRRYAERACRLILPLARAHGMQTLWITCNPENYASRRTCERLGATLVDVVPLPQNHMLYQRGERAKCRYRLDLYHEFPTRADDRTG